MRKMCIRCGLLVEAVTSPFIHLIAWLCPCCEEDVCPDFDRLWVDLGGEGGGA